MLDRVREQALEWAERIDDEQERTREVSGMCCRRRGLLVLTCAVHAFICRARLLLSPSRLRSLPHHDTTRQRAEVMAPALRTARSQSNSIRAPIASHHSSHKEQQGGNEQKQADEWAAT